MSTTGTTGRAPDVEDPRTRDPWQRFGWLIWATWLVFLGFPLLAAANAEDARLRVLGVTATLAFGVVYALLTHRLMDEDHVARGRLRASHVLALGVLVALAATTTPVIGLGAMSFLPFLTSYGNFALPRPACWIWSATVVVVAAATPALAGATGEWLSLTVIVLAVTAGTAGGRIMADLGEQAGQVAEELAVTTERDRVARDVHDVLGHSLTVVAVKAQLAERLIDVDPERARAELADIQQLTRQALAEVRSTVGGLRTARLDDELAGATRALTAAGIAPTVPASGEVLEPRHRAVAAWVLREAVTNVVRHSEARTCRVELLPEGLRVVDDGRGVGATDRGNGLRGLEERVAGSGGRLDLGDAAGGGTRLEVAW